MSFAHVFSWLTLLAVLLLPSTSNAHFHEEQIDLPVKVTDAYGKVIEQGIKVTIFHDDANPQPAPVAVLNHGRAPSAEARANFGRARYFDISKFLVQRGFIVVVPTRIGYGVTGGEDIEDTGPCNRKNYPPALTAAAKQVVAALEAVRQRPDAAKDRAVVIGQSFGGATAVAVASMNPPGVQAAINFAGGAGGDPKARPQQPCASHRLEELFSNYGKIARIPMLWVYAENDMYFGRTLPREWFEAYIANGAKAEFVQFPPQGEDGHQLFTRFLSTWQPRVAEFLDASGFKIPAPKAP